MVIDPRVDLYIAEAQPFARPVLTHIRALIHRHCTAAEEAIKWSFPAFSYRGRLLATMASFTAHASLGFWYGRMVTGDLGREGEGMGSFGRLTSITDLPPDEALGTMIMQSMALIEAGVRPPHQTKPAAPKPEAIVPPPLAAALAANQSAQRQWEAFAPGQRREYCGWIAEAKREDTRARRIADAITWIAEGKTRNWKYENC